MAGEETTPTAPSPETSVPQVGSRPATEFDGNRCSDGLWLAPADLWPYQTATGWGSWPAFFAVVVITILSLGVAMAGSVLLINTSGHSPLETLKSGTPLILFFTAQILMILGALLAARARGGSLVRALALGPPLGGFMAYVKSLAIMLIAVALYTAFTSFVIRHDVCQDLGEMSGLFRGPFWPLALVVIGAGAPLSEELLFRGFLQSALVPSRLGYWGASIVTTTFWTLLHAGYSLPGLVEVFMIGLIFAWLLRRTGSLRVTLVCHAIYNTGIALLLIFAPNQTFGC